MASNAKVTFALRNINPILVYRGGIENKRLEANAKDQGHNAEVISKKRSALKKITKFPQNSSDFQTTKHKKMKKVFALSNP